MCICHRLRRVIHFNSFIEALLEQFSKASWDDGIVSKSVNGNLQKRRHEYQKVVAHGSMKPYSGCILLLLFS